MALPQAGLGKAFSLSVLLDKCHAHFLNVKRKHGENTTFLSKVKAESLKYHSPGHRPGLIDSPHKIADCRSVTVGIESQNFSGIKINTPEQSFYFGFLIVKAATMADVTTPIIMAPSEPCIM